MANQTRPSKGKSYQKNKNRIFPFTRENYLYMIIGLVVVLIGYLLMIGGQTSDPNQFHPDQVYSFRRITLAPIVIIIGFLLEIYAIFKTLKKKKANSLNSSE